ncbi:hypothetical protein Gpo141_00011401 [Globisporangium polare]
MTKRVLLLAASLSTCVAQDVQPLLPETTVVTTTSTSSSIDSSSNNIKPTPTAEPFWGRIYLRHGVAPIQYFRDSFGGPMVDTEVEFVFPADQSINRFGCEQLDEDELLDVTAGNRSVVLVVDRGECTFEEKSRNAQKSGAAGLLVISADESVSRPVALVDAGEIAIPSMMARKSAGALLRAAVLGFQTRVFGRLVPMVCTRSPYRCSPRTKGEQKYVDAFMARSGVLVSNEGQVLGEFLSSTFGGIMPQTTAGAGLPVSALLPAAVVCQNLDTEKMPRLDGQVALIAASDAATRGSTAENSGCSLVDLVTNAQLAGATAALIIVDKNTTVSSHPSVLEDWHGYNATVFSAAISASTALRIVEMQQSPDGSALTVKFELKNEIADAWDQIHELSVASAWPQRRDRKEKLIKRLLATFSLNVGQTEALKSHFLTIAGGSRASWGLLMADEKETGDVVDHNLAIQDDTAKLTDSVVTVSESHEEL